MQRQTPARGVTATKRCLLSGEQYRIIMKFILSEALKNFMLLKRDLKKSMTVIIYFKFVCERTAVALLPKQCFSTQAKSALPKIPSSEFFFVEIILASQTCAGSLISLEILKLLYLEIM